MPVERFEPSTLAGLVFETSAYTVPPHRLIRDALYYAPLVVLIIAHLGSEVKRLDLNLRSFRGRFSPKVSNISKLLIAFFQQFVWRHLFQFCQMA
jgi:hypothetical protein